MASLAIASCCFPALTSSAKPISDMTLSMALRWHGQFRHDVIEALAREDGDAILATYNRATYIKEHRELAQGGRMN